MSRRYRTLMWEARRRMLVGRAGEAERFVTWLRGGLGDVRILHLAGPGGIGKTTLVDQFADLAQAEDVPSYLIDARAVDPSPAGLNHALCQATGEAGLDSAVARLAAASCLLVIDSWERLAPVDEWFRTSLLPDLPDTVRVVLSGRRPASAGWRADPALSSLQWSINLRNLDRTSARAYLSSRAVPADQHPAILDFTHGHPLALSLVADLFAQSEGFEFAPRAAPDVVRILLERLFDAVPNGAYRSALEVAGVARVTTEALLAAVLDERAEEAFDWLAGLTCFEPLGIGLAPHDLARDALTFELRWRNPDRFEAVHARIRAYYRERLQHRNPDDQTAVLMDYVFLHRDSPFVRPFLEWEGADLYLDEARGADRDAVLEAARRHEGDEAAAVAGQWLEIRPHAFTILRAPGGGPAGHMLVLPVHELVSGDVEFDAAVLAVLGLSGPWTPRPGEHVLYFRSWMDHEHHQAISTVQSRVFLEAVRRHLTTPALAYTLFSCRDPEFWAPMFTYADLEPVPELAFGDHRGGSGVYGHDWRVRPPAAWLDLLAERETATHPDLRPPDHSEEPVVLSEPDFRAAVIDALRTYTTPAGLAGNPLVRSRMVRDRGGDDPVATLRGLISGAAHRLEQSARDRKLYTAVYHGYLNPAASQEAASELAHVSFSTFRRHLKQGRERIADELWLAELGRS